MAVRARPDNLGLDHPDEAAAADAVARAFDELWEHRHHLRATSRRIVADEGAADDVVQETFLRALTADRLDRRASFGPWLAVVARRRSIDRLRSEGRVRPVAAPPDRACGAVDGPEEQVLQQERVARVRAALAELSARERQLLLRQIAHGVSLAELAAEEATSIASVRSVLARARTKLRVSLERGGPLGAAPVPGLAAAVKRRLHRWAARFEGSTPMLAGAGAQFGDAVVAVVAAAALLLGTSVSAPEPGPTRIEMASSEHAAAQRQPPSGPGHPPGSPTPPRGRHQDPSGGSATSDQATGPSWKPLAQPPPVDLPGLPHDGADQPEETFPEHIAASEDGRTLVIVGRKNVTADSSSGMGVYRSDDGGHTWRQLNASTFTSGSHVLLRDGALFVVSGSTLLRSDDGGEDFFPAGTSRDGVTAVAGDADDPRIFLAPAGLLAYDAHTGLPTPYSATPAAMQLGGLGVHVTPSGPRFMLGLSTYTSTGMLQGYVQRCSTTACEDPVALPGMRRAPSILVSQSVPGLALAWYGNQLFRSVDSGLSFASVTMPAGAIHTIVEDGDGDLLLARSDPGHVSSGLLRSVDGGQTWTSLGLGTPVEQGAEGLVVTGNGRIVVGLNDVPGIRCSADDGVTWAPRCPAL